MNFDDLKSNFQSLSFNEGQSGNIDFTRKVENAFDQVRREDIRDKQRFWRLMIIFIGVGLAFCVMGILNYIRNPEGYIYWGYALYVLALILIIPFIISKYKRMSNVNYDVPVIEFIEHVEKRFSLFQMNQLWLIPTVITIDISFIFLIARSDVSLTETVLKSQFIFILLVTFAILVRMIAWRKKIYLLDELRRIKQSLTQEKSED